MMFPSPRQVFVSAALACTALAAQAATVYASSPVAQPERPTDNAYNVKFKADAGPATLSFVIQGHDTIDGDNCCIDLFLLTVNDVHLFTGTWDLGGGGTNRTIFDSNGAQVTWYPTRREVAITVPITLVQGRNRLQFTYESPSMFEGSARSGFEGIGNEGWSIGHITVTTPD